MVAIPGLAEEADHGVDEAWTEEVERRLSELRAGSVTAVPAADVNERIGVR